MDKRNAIMSLSTSNHRWLYDVTNKTKAEYCAAHGMDFVFKDGVIDENWHPMWQRFPLFMDNFDKYSYMVWMDDDAFILRNDYNINEMLSLMTDDNGKYMLMSKDWNGLNSGVMCMRCCNESLAMLRWCWENRTEFYFHRDQQCICNYISEHPHCVVDTVPHRFMNGYTKMFHGQFVDYLAREDSFIAHLAGGERTKSDMEATLFEVNRYINGFR